MTKESISSLITPSKSPALEEFERQNLTSNINYFDFFFDYDGCLDNIFDYKTHPDNLKIKLNSVFLNHLTERFNEIHRPAIIRFHCASTRQNEKINRLNHEKHRNGDAFKAIRFLTEFFNEKYTGTNIAFEFDTFLLPDALYKLDPGTTMLAGQKKFKLETDTSTIGTFYDERKINLYFTHAQRSASRTRGNPVTILAYDDLSELDTDWISAPNKHLMERIKSLIEANPNLYPKNAYFELYYFASYACPDIKAPKKIVETQLQGKGPILSQEELQSYSNRIMGYEKFQLCCVNKFTEVSPNPTTKLSNHDINFYNKLNKELYNKLNTSENKIVNLTTNLKKVLTERCKPSQKQAFFWETRIHPDIEILKQLERPNLLDEIEQETVKVLASDLKKYDPLKHVLTQLMRLYDECNQNENNRYKNSALA